jgi:hypothetical protein
MPGTTCLRLAILLAAALSTTTGCATLSNAELEYRDYQRAEFRNQFLDERTRCQQRGGRIYVDAKQTLGRDGIPKRGDRYFCA